MSELPKPFPEMGASTDPKEVPWVDAVVWSSWTGSGPRVYEWLDKSHIRNAHWTTGTVSIQIEDASFLAGHLKFMLVQAPLISIGKNVPVA